MSRNGCVGKTPWENIREKVLDKKSNTLYRKFNDKVKR